MIFLEKRIILRSVAAVLTVSVVFGIALFNMGDVGFHLDSACAQAPVPKDQEKQEKDAALLKQHPWATFTPGVWKSVRIVSESFDKEGQPLETSLTDTKSTLASLDEKGITLSVEVSLWLAGRRLDPKPQNVELGYHGEVGLFEKEEGKELEPVEVTIEGEAIPCKVREITLTEPEGKRVRVIKLFYNDEVFPFLLRRESEIRETETNTVLSKTTMVINSLNMPWEACGKLFSVAIARTAKVSSKENVTSLTFLSSEVPGLVVYEATKETDSQGKMIRRSVSRMNDFSTNPDSEPRPGLLKRIRAARTSQSTAVGEEED